MGVKSYQELIVWQKSMEVAKMIYSLVKKLPKEELFALSDPMRRTFALTDISEVMQQLQEVGKMLHALTKTLPTAH